ncbi:ABC transporter ATP-binding protein [Umezawaea sp. NPDC059074]|uniref:ABC transporter ATP-binding protein n=1 Tax=Umezawaea sp. NPDC059074 TaxID=3346716 RepID=UPI003688E61A
MAQPGDPLLVKAANHDRRWLLLVLNAALATTAGLLLPAALAGTVDMALSGRFDSSTVLWLVSMVSIEVVGDAIGVVLAAAITAKVTAWLRHRVAAHLLGLGHPSPFAAGDAVSRVTGDSAIAGGISVIVIMLTVTVVSSVGAVVALALMDWRLAAVFLLSVPLAMLLVRTHMRLTADDVATYQNVSGELSARLLDAVAGLRTIAVSGTAEQEADRVLRPLPALSAAGIGMWRTQAKMIWRAGLLLPAVELAVLTAAGFGVVAGRLSIGDLLATLGYVALGMGVVGQLPVLTTLARTRASATRLVEVLDTPLPRRDAPLAPASPGDVELHDVSVGGALHDVRLRIPAGTFTAVVGRSGAGKSVLAAVIGGLSTPDSGEVRRDGVVGYAFERPALLGATVGEAVRYGADAGKRRARAACQTAQVHDVVVRLPAGYDTPMADTPLSGGEAQRLGLARALARDPDVLVLDDATASLDMVTEATVDKAIEAALPGRTKVVVTHRAATARRADLVVWLVDGRVRATGSHEVLWLDPDYRTVFTGGDA